MTIRALKTYKKHRQNPDASSPFRNSPFKKTEVTKTDTWTEPALKG